jgi:nicotinate phosphoribosyltransferase
LKKEPIFKSHLDDDVYKFHVGSFFFDKFSEVEAIYAYKCRDKDVNLRPIYDDFCEQIEMMSDVILSKDEEKWLFENTKVTQNYLKNFLVKFRFNPKQVHIKKISENPGIEIRPKGRLCETSLWEMPLMYILSELYFKNLYGDSFQNNIFNTAKIDLIQKIDKLKQTLLEEQISNFFFSEFGTRRRLSHEFQDFAVEHLKSEVSNCLVGTSNMYFAKKYNLKAVGSVPHEATMLYQALVHAEDSQVRFLQDWIEFYRGWLSIALTDTLGRKKWNKDFNKKLMTEYTGQRHDSADPYSWGEQRLLAYKKAKIDTDEKTLLFSDNLDFDKSLKLTKHFGQRIKVSHGIGTFITNNIPSLSSHKALNQIIKIVQANGRPVCKLSDDPMKAQCEDPIFLEYMKKIAR